MAYTDQHLFFDDVQIGQSWDSQGRTITEADIVNFAGLSGDFNPIHVDEQFAAGTPFRRRIAHGLLVLSVGSGLSVQVPAMRTLAVSAIHHLEFRGPVYIGDTIFTRSTIVEIEPRSRNRRAQVTWNREVINQDGKVVQQATAVTLIEGRAAYEGKGTARNTKDGPVRAKSSST